MSTAKTQSNLRLAFRKPKAKTDKRAEPFAAEVISKRQILNHERIRPITVNPPESLNIGNPKSKP